MSFLNPVQMAKLETGCHWCYLGLVFAEANHFYAYAALACLVLEAISQYMQET